MYQPRQRRSARSLWLLILAAIIYGSLLTLRHTLTGMVRLDGAIGVVLGLFICSRPVANLLDLVLFGHVTRSQVWSRRSLALWVLLNLLVVFVGYIVISMGAARFAFVIH